MSLPFTVIICIVLLSAILISIVIFGNSPNFRNTPIYKLRLKILRWNHDIIAWINYVDSHVFGNKLVFYSGWLVPLFYIIVVSFCLHQFFTKVYKLLPLFVKKKWLSFNLHRIYNLVHFHRHIHGYVQ